MEKEYIINFKIDVPYTAIKSDFNSLIIRMHEMKTFIESANRYDYEIRDNNRNIREIQKILDNFIVPIEEE